MERFFLVHKMSEKEKIALSIISLDGEVFAWFQWEDDRRPTGCNSNFGY